MVKVEISVKSGGKVVENLFVYCYNSKCNLLSMTYVMAKESEKYESKYSS